MSIQGRIVYEQIPACSHCGQTIGVNRRCWWCDKIAADAHLSFLIDRFMKRGENAVAFLPQWLAQQQAEIGVFF